ncbi:MAG: CBS domain-containing protein [Ilumatobacteraceae bacterium]
MLHRSGVGVAPSQTIRAAAAIMEQAGVGSLAVVEGERLVGIVTDRDLVRRALARGLEGDARIDSVMTSPVITVEADDSLDVAYGLFATHGLRRLAVMRGDNFVGMLTIDDLLVALAEQLSSLARPITAEILFPHRDPAVPVAT